MNKTYIQWEKNDTITALGFFGINPYGPVEFVGSKSKNTKTSNFAAVCHKQDLLVIIPIYNKIKMKPSQLQDSSGLIRTDLRHLLDQNKKMLKLHIIWVVKIKNSDKMDQNSNFSIVCHKQDLLVFIPIYNKKKMTPSQLQDSLGLINTVLWHLLDQIQKSLKESYNMK